MKIVVTEEQNLVLGCVLVHVTGTRYFKALCKEHKQAVESLIDKSIKNMKEENAKIGVS